jgi:hypothetical protein
MLQQQQQLQSMLKHLPGIKAVIVHNDFEATIVYKNGMVRGLHSDTGILWLLDSFLVPVRHSSDFDSILAYNRAIDEQSEATAPINADEDYIIDSNRTAS